MGINIKDISILRELTGAGMLDCKKALEESNGNVDAAVTYLREKGIAKAAKKQTRVAAEGLCSYKVQGNSIILFELNSETDFVAKNEKFLNLITQLENIFAVNLPANNDAALLCKEGKLTVQDILTEAIAQIGEKISLRRVTRLDKKPTQVFGLYKHLGGKIVAATVLEGTEETAKNIAMHVAAFAPKYISSKDVDQALIDEELHIIKEQVYNENRESSSPKPEKVLDNIIKGRLNKNLEQYVLFDQAYVKEPGITVKQYLEQSKATIIAFERLKVGEGIQKKQDDFAKEVEQLAGK
jgi:elongation factor Ts